MSEVLGYEACRRCGRLHPELMLQRCGGVCRACLSLVTDRLRPIEAANAGRVRAIGQRHRSGPRRGDRSNDIVGKSARNAALARLRACFPDLYEALLIEERARRGIEPVSLSPRSPDINPALVEAAFKMAEQHFGRHGA